MMNYPNPVLPILTKQYKILYNSYSFTLKSGFHLYKREDD